MCASIISFILSLNDQSQPSFIKRIPKLKLPITCETCTFCTLIVFKYFFRKKNNVEKSLQSWERFRDGRSGYSKHSFFRIIQFCFLMGLRICS